LIGKKSAGKSTYASKYSRSETIVLDDENFGSSSYVTQPRKRGRPRTNAINVRLQSMKGPKISVKASDRSLSPGRTILHDAVDIFLKPAMPNSRDIPAGKLNF
jgi:hypothetical protein